MDINNFFISAIRDHAHYHRAWVIRVFGVALDDPNKPPTKEWEPIRTSADVQVKLPNGAIEKLEGVVLGQPIMGPHTIVYVPKNFFSLWPEGGYTTAGNLFYNATAIWPVVGKNIPYQNGKVDERKIEAYFQSMVADPPNPEDRDPNLIYVSDWLKYGQAIKYLEEASPLFVWTMSRNSIVPNKEVLARKQELITQAEANGTITDPVTQTKIIKELEDLDKKMLAKEPGANFMLAGKSVIARRKLTIMYGAEQGLDVSKKPHLITQSLHDGLRPEHMTDVMNVSRAGSFDRGSETMLGGVEAKWGDRGMMGSSVQDEDCGTTLGYTYLVTPDDVKNTVNRYLVLPDNSLKLIATQAEAIALVGQIIKVRSPNRCLAGPSTRWCKFCLGANLSANTKAIGLAVSAYGSGFLQLFLQSMHAKAQVTVKLDIRKLMS